MQEYDKMMIKGDKMIIERGEGFEHEKNDCIIKAITAVTNYSYFMIHKTLKYYGRKDRHGIPFFIIHKKVFKKLNIKFLLIKRSGTVRKLIKQFPEGKIICLKRGHLFAVINSKILDTTSENCIIKYAWLINEY